ncbi:hypothetical protein RDWZM_010537 [Blomia tropicalis]|uniref:SET domain-containing protein n=1 Tax=Blomia tropicalis TaxID=40697 RepID=A0A9Q0LZD5_BLOTA|nr:hypothetical protein RDWZM_010537 [Blomia tropicalis]
MSSEISESYNKAISDILHFAEVKSFYKSNEWEILRSPEFDFGLYSKCPIVSGSCVLTIPSNLVVTAQMIRNMYPQQFENFPRQDDDLVLIVFIMKGTNNPNEWGTYIETMSIIFLPCTLNFESLKNYRKVLPGSLSDSIDETVDKMLKRYWRLLALVEENPYLAHAGHRIDITNFELFSEKYTAFLTRSMSIPTCDRSGIELALIPIADLVNHSPDPNVKPYRLPNGDFQIIATKEIGRSKQLFFRYNDYTNRELMLHYGFSTNIPHELEIAAGQMHNNFWIRPSMEDGIPINFQYLSEWIESLDSKNNVPIYAKRLLSLIDASLIESTNKLRIGWPSPRYSNMKICVLTNDKNRYRSLKNSPIEINELISLSANENVLNDIRLDGIFQLLSTSEWGPMFTIKAMVVEFYQKLFIIENNDRKHLKCYYQLWIDFLRWLLKRDYQLDLSSNVPSSGEWLSLFLESIKHKKGWAKAFLINPIRDIVINEWALIMVQLEIFEYKLSQLE